MNVKDSAIRLIISILFTLYGNYLINVPAFFNAPLYRPKIKLTHPAI